MAKRIKRDVADAFSAALEETEEWQSEINLRELVEDAFFSIEKARDKKATWEQIAAVLQKTIGTEIEIKADTVRQYYFDAVARKDELAKKQRQKAAKNRAKKKLSSQKNPAKLKPNQSTSDASAPTSTEVLPGVNGEAESSFALRPRKET